MLVKLHSPTILRRPPCPLVVTRLISADRCDHNDQPTHFIAVPFPGPLNETRSGVFRSTGIICISQHCVAVHRQQSRRRARRNDGSRGSDTCLQACQRHRCESGPAVAFPCPYALVYKSPVCSTRIPTCFFFLLVCVLQLWPSRRKQRTAFANHFIIVPASQKGDTIYMKFLDTGKEQIARVRARVPTVCSPSSVDRADAFFKTSTTSLLQQPASGPRGGATRYENLRRA